MSNELNFSGGPGALPASVLQQLQQAMIALPDTGLSVLGMSHRSDWFRSVLDEAEANLRLLLDIPANYHVLFLQGGSSLQFSMLPMNVLRGTRQHADYIASGYWSAKAIPEARLEGEVRVAWDGQPHGYDRLPTEQELQLSPDAAYLHYVSNETVEGVQFTQTPGLPGVPLVADMSSDLLAGPLDVSRHAMIYAHAQKNLGPAGVTVVILRDSFANSPASPLPSLLDYRSHISSRSLYNTPPVFAIYALLLVTRWLRDDMGGLAAMAEINRQKASQLYQTLDKHAGLYHVHAHPQWRSQMNIAFSLPTPALQQQFLQGAQRQGLHGLEGHRSLGGLRASLYNAVTPQAVASLCQWLDAFASSTAL